MKFLIEMIRYLMVLIQVLVYMLIRIRLGFRLTYHEKNQLLEGFLKLGQNFIEEYKDEAAAELGAPRMGVSPCNHLCVSEVSHN
jgi:hypothetical protein